MGRVCLLLAPLTAKQVCFDDQTRLSTSKWGFVPDLDLLSSMKTMFQVGLNEHVPAPPEKRFLIHANHASLKRLHSAPPVFSPLPAPSTSLPDHVKKQHIVQRRPTTLLICSIEDDLTLAVINDPNQDKQ